jgi:lytic murein transglycosylase
MGFPGLRGSLLTILVVMCLLPSPVLAAASCGGDFSTWLANFKRLAASKGISEATISSGLAGVIYDPAIIYKDRHQGVFHQTFEQFSGRMVPPRLGRAASLLKQDAGLLKGIEQRYGVPGPILIAIWGLETDFGADTGTFPTIRSLATLAFDCRRSPKFTDELVAALLLVQQGHLSPGRMRGSWAGELGQTQFLPSSYLKYAVGGRDLINSPADALASTANYLKGYGWQRGGPWGEGSANFQVLLQWNKSTVYSKTVAYFASKLAGG